MNKVTGFVRFIGMPVYSHQYNDVNYYVLQAETIVIKGKTPTTVRIRSYLPEDLVMSSTIEPVSKIYSIVGHLINSWVKFHEDLSVIIDEVVEAEDQSMTISQGLLVEVSGVVGRITTTPQNMKSFFGIIISTTNDDDNDVVNSRVLSRGALMKYVSKEARVGLVAIVKGYLTNLFNRSDNALLTEVTAYAIQFKQVKGSVK